MADPVMDPGNWLGSKVLPPILGLVGASLMLLWTRELDPRRMAVALIFGPIAAWLVPPILVPALRSWAVLAWLPKDGSVEGLVGLLVGIAAINLVSLWLKFSSDPRAALQSVKEGTDNAH